MSTSVNPLEPTNKLQLRKMAFRKAQEKPVVVNQGRSTIHSESSSDDNEQADEPDELELHKERGQCAIIIIIFLEFADRFSFIGVRVILSIYLTTELEYREMKAKYVYHSIMFLVYCTPIIGGLMADSCFGKFNTIIVMSCISCIGCVALLLTSLPILYLPPTTTMIGLVLMAFGCGGIKPCLAALGGDQFILPIEERKMHNFFGWFYFALNAGTLVSAFIMPILRTISCFNSDQCFPSVFALSSITMIIGLVVFSACKRTYRLKKTEENMLILCCKCICYAIMAKARATERKNHWLDYAIEKYGIKLVQDIKDTIKVLKLYIPVPLFWSLLLQTGSTWVFQAGLMNGFIGSIQILPDQLFVINPLLIMIFIPIFQYYIYPLFIKLNFLKRPLHRMAAGGIMGGIAFIVCGILYTIIEKEEPVLPKRREAHLIIHNNLPCDLAIHAESIYGSPFTIVSFDKRRFIKNVTESFYADYKITSDCYVTNGRFIPKAGAIISYYASNTKEALNSFTDTPVKDVNGYAVIRTLISLDEFVKAEETRVQYVNSDGVQVVETSVTDTSRKIMHSAGSYTVTVGQSTKSIKLQLGGVYILYVHINSKLEMLTKLLVVTDPNYVNILWMIPQHLLITIGEIMFSVTGLEFTYSQAPPQMKTVLQSFWLLTIAFGSAIVMIVQSITMFTKQSYLIFTYAGLIFVDMGIFILMTVRYRYVSLRDGLNEDFPISARRAS